MAIKVTGFFKNPLSGMIFESPTLELIPHLEYAGRINMDVRINSNSGAVGYENVDRSTLKYDITITDPYSQLIDALTTMAIENLQNANDINKASTFEKFNPSKEIVGISTEEV